MARGRGGRREVEPSSPRARAGCTAAPMAWIRASGGAGKPGLALCEPGARARSRVGPRAQRTRRPRAFTASGLDARAVPSHSRNTSNLVVPHSVCMSTESRCEWPSMADENDHTARPRLVGPRGGVVGQTLALRFVRAARQHAVAGGQQRGRAVEAVLHGLAWAEVAHLSPRLSSTAMMHHGNGPR
jgi:hypothetical protein